MSLVARSGRLKLRNDALPAAAALVPGVTAASVFTVPDRASADVLLGSSPQPPLPAAPPPAGSADEVALLRDWMARKVLIAVGPAGVHLCEWDDWTGSTREVARFEREQVQVGVDRWRSAVRVTLRHSNGYAVALVGNLSRWWPFGGATREVVAALGH